MKDNAVGTGQILRPTVTSADAQLISPISENLFIAGKSFSMEDYFTFSEDEVKIFLFDSLAFEGENLTFSPFLFDSTAGPIRIDYYTGSDSDDDGTILMATNRREKFPSPKSILRLNPSNFVPGTRFSGDLVPATAQNPAKTIGAASSPGLPFEIDASVKHAMKMTNDNGAGTIVEIKITWFEV